MCYRQCPSFGNTTLFQRHLTLHSYVLVQKMIRTFDFSSLIPLRRLVDIDNIAIQTAMKNYQQGYYFNQAHKSGTFEIQTIDSFEPADGRSLSVSGNISGTECTQAVGNPSEISPVQENQPDRGTTLDGDKLETSVLTLEKISDTSGSPPHVGPPETNSTMNSVAEDTDGFRRECISGGATPELAGPQQGQQGTPFHDRDLTPPTEKINSSRTQPNQVATPQRAPSSPMPKNRNSVHSRPTAR